MEIKLGIHSISLETEVEMYSIFKMYREYEGFFFFFLPISFLLKGFITSD